MSKLKEFGVSLVRTSVVPPLAGFILMKLAEWQITIDETTVSTIVFAVCSAIWYAAFRLIEIFSQNPKFIRWAGILLGAPKAPDYENTLKLREKVTNQWTVEGGGTHSETTAYVTDKGKIIGEFTANTGDIAHKLQ